MRVSLTPLHDDLRSAHRVSDRSGAAQFGVFCAAGRGGGTNGSKSARGCRKDH